MALQKKKSPHFPSELLSIVIEPIGTPFFFFVLLPFFIALPLPRHHRVGIAGLLLIPSPQLPLTEWKITKDS